MNKINIDSIHISVFTVPEIPYSNVIIKYRVVQTGANIQSGGLKVGLLNNEYQGSLKFISS